MSATLSSLYASVRSGLSLRDRDPLAFHHFPVQRIREAVAALSGDQPVDELAARSCNKGCKSTSLASIMLALAQKRPTLDDIPLPQWHGPLSCVQFCLDYPQQLLSIQPAYLKLLGQWPCKPRWKGDQLSSLRIMPVSGGSDESAWSTIRFVSEQNKRSGVGVRSDVAGFDEPPPIEILREMRKAGHAGRRGIRLVWFTPTLRRQWAPLLEDYGDGPRKSFRRIGNRWAEVRWSIDEVADWVLSAAEKQALLEDWSKDPLLDARQHGDYVDASASCPWNVPALIAMMAECVEPDVRDWNISREVDAESGRRVTTAKVQVLVLKDPVPGHSYYLNIDPSQGIPPTHDALSTHRDPGGILVHDETADEDVALYEGYIGSYGLGSLAAGLAKQYNDAWTDPEYRGWSEGVLRGLADAGYAKICKDTRIHRDGSKETVWDFRTDTITRPGMIAELRAWQDAYLAGAPYAACRFSRVIQTLLDTILDPAGKTVAQAGYHDEFMILKGQQLRKLHRTREDANLARPLVVPVVRRGGMTVDELTKRLVGERADETPFQGVPPMIPRGRSRG